MSDISAFESFVAGKKWENLEEAGNALGDKMIESLILIYSGVPTYLDRLEALSNQTDIDQAAIRQQEKLGPALELLNGKPLRDRIFIQANLAAIAAAIDTTTPDPVE